MNLVSRLPSFVLVSSLALSVSAEFAIDRSAMSDAYWKIRNAAEQAKIDADIEANLKADCEVKVGGEGEDSVSLPG